MTRIVRNINELINVFSDCQNFMVLLRQIHLIFHRIGILLLNNKVKQKKLGKINACDFEQP